jgi:nicotinamidase-related amidase
MYPMNMPQNAALMIIDVQNIWDDPRFGRRNNPDAEQNIVSLLHAWRESKRPIFYFQHISRNPASFFQADNPAIGIRDIVRPLAGETVMQKHAHSAFIGTGLEKQLRQQGITTVFITGFMTNHCVETTARMAGDLEFETYVVADGTATFDRKGPDGVLHTAEEIYAMTLTNLHKDFATITTTKAVLQDVVTTHHL